MSTLFAELRSILADEPTAAPRTFAPCKGGKRDTVLDSTTPPHSLRLRKQVEDAYPRPKDKRDRFTAHGYRGKNGTARTLAVKAMDESEAEQRFARSRARTLHLVWAHRPGHRTVYRIAIWSRTKAEAIADLTARGFTSLDFNAGTGYALTNEQKGRTVDYLVNPPARMYTFGGKPVKGTLRPLHVVIANRRAAC